MLLTRIIVKAYAIVFASAALSVVINVCMYVFHTLSRLPTMMGQPMSELGKAPSFASSLLEGGCRERIT